MEISKVKRSENNEQYVSWKDDNHNKGTVLLDPKLDWLNMSDAEKEAYVREHGGIPNKAPAAKMVSTAADASAPEELKVKATPVAAATKPAT